MSNSSAGRRLRWRVVGMSSVVAVTALLAAPWAVAAGEVAPSPVVVTGVRLESRHDDAGNYTYTATVVDADGVAVRGASLDIGGLSDDPDVRLTTRDMKVTTDPSSYAATVQFPSQGDWMLVVRVHEPSQLVDVFTERVDNAPASASHHGLESNPAKRAVVALDPTFYDRYNPSNPTPGSASAASSGATIATDLSHGHDGTVTAATTGAAGSGHPFDLSVAAMALLHSAAALAWLLSVAVLALANRFGPGNARNEAIRFLSRRYSLLAGGGMVAAMLTGVVMAQEASAGILHPSRLLASALGTAYLAVFAVKMLLVVVSP